MTDTPAPDEVAVPEAVGPTPPEVPRKPKRLGLIIGLAAAAVVAWGGLGVFLAHTAAQYSPEKQAQEFVQALVDGDASLALDHVSTLPDGNKALLSDAVYSATEDRPTGFEIVSTEVDGSRATVSVVVTQAGEEFSYDLALERVDRVVLYDVWRVNADALPTVDVSFPRPASVTLDVNGTDLALLDGSFVTNLPALPGRYDFAPQGLTDYYTAEPVTVNVTFDDSGTSKQARLKTELTEAGIASARAAASNHLNACLAQATLHPSGRCGIDAIPGPGQNYTNLRWTITAAPGLSFDGWSQQGWAVVTDSPAQFRLDADFTNSEGYGNSWWTWDDYYLWGKVTEISPDGVAVYVSDYDE